MHRSTTYKMILTAILSAIGVVGGSMFEFTVGVAKVAPMQHLINLISGVLVGPLVGSDPGIYHITVTEHSWHWNGPCVSWQHDWGILCGLAISQDPKFTGGGLR